ncbi:MAG TPA: hypothetical protein VIJ01_19495 [Candidatus Angelobacter sp.]
MAHKTYTLAFTQQVARPLAEVFEFFSRAENLQVLTPPWLNFKILEVTPQPVQKGTLINYSLRVHGIPLRWTVRLWNGSRRTALSIYNCAGLTSCGGMSIVLSRTMAGR